LADALECLALLPDDLAAMSQITRILDRAQQGEAQAAEELLPLVYQELRGLAASKLAQQPPGQTLQATALVHEAFLRLTGGTRDRWQDRSHFFRAAAEAMRCILIENARRKSTWKRGGKLERVALEKLRLAVVVARYRVHFADRQHLGSETRGWSCETRFRKLPPSDAQSDKPLRHPG
jgi:RNA polymerase sigma factor (TIGR02999 family)